MKKVLTLSEAFSGDALAATITNTWHTYNTQRGEQIAKWKEQRNFVFATDTTTTSNKSLPWKNSTTLPKLCQIRDNLHSNYLSAIFPNDDWLQWEAYSKKANAKQKKNLITAYISNKTRENGFRSIISQALYDFIDYGNCFGTVDFETSYKELNGERVVNYVGPVAKRISPLDIVFNPLAASFRDSFKIVRSVMDKGAFVALINNYKDKALLENALKNKENMMSSYRANNLDDLEKSEAYQVDGFGNYAEYLGSDTVELLTYHGDIYNDQTGEYLTGREIVVLDRMWVISNQTHPSWLGYAPIFHAGWRLRPDNLWAMGPLENLVGMQYRIDHLENAKADAFDLGILPPLKIKGDVEAFTYAPGSEIHLDENGDVEELARNVQWVINADNNIALYEQRMEQYAGAPREAMGVRSPGEKTMFEVSQLMNASGRIFQEKTTSFEIEFLEKLLNAMLEISRRNMDGADVVRVLNKDDGITEFLNITRDDITASGVLRPIGARHFAAQAQLVQNLSGLANTPIWQQIAVHMSNKKLAELVEDVLNLNRFSLFSPHVGIFEQQEAARLGNQAAEDLQVEQSMGTDVPPA